MHPEHGPDGGMKKEHVYTLSKVNAHHFQRHSDFAFDDTVSVSFYAYQQTFFKLFVYRLLSVLTAGLLVLVCYWFPKLYIKLTMVRCPMTVATHAFCINSFGQSELVSFESGGSVLDLELLSKVNLPEALPTEEEQAENEKYTPQIQRYFSQEYEAISLKFLNYRYNRFLLDPRSGRLRSIR